MATKKKDVLSIEKFCNKRAISARNSWLKKANQLEYPLPVPTRKEIQEWLETNISEKIYFIDYLSNKPIHYLSMELDHKIPTSKGGSFSLDNIGITSRFYNNAKGDMTEEEFRSLLNVIKDWEPSSSLGLLLRLIRSNRIFK